MLPPPRACAPCLTSCDLCAHWRATENPPRRPAPRGVWCTVLRQKLLSDLSRMTCEQFTPEERDQGVVALRAQRQQEEMR